MRDLLGDLAMERDVEDEVPLTPASEFTVAGRDLPRVDAVARVTGRAKYSQDIVLDGMLFAAVLRPPWRGAKHTSVDTGVAERMPGVVRVVQDRYLVAVLADTDEHAIAACALVQAQWEGEPDPSTPLDLPELLMRSGHDAFTTQEQGSLEEGFKAAEHVLETTYFVPYVSNAPMEPRAAVAAWDGDRLTVWAGTQRPFGIRTELAQRFEIPEGDVRVIAPEIGGGFGSKSPYPVAHEAARLSRIAGRPVRVAYTRAEDMTEGDDAPRRADHHQERIPRRRHRRRLGVQGLPRRRAPVPRPPRLRDSVQHRAHQRHDVHIGLTARDRGRTARSAARRTTSRAKCTWMRSPRHAASIRSSCGCATSRTRASGACSSARRRPHGWRASGARSGAGQGVAIGVDVGSYVATCVDLDVQGAEVRVSRVTAALDCGLVVNPEGVRNQVEGAIVMGLGTALYEAIDYQDGRVLNAGFTRYRVPRSTDAPAIETVIVGDDDTPSTGAGEPGIVPDRRGDLERRLRPHRRAPPRAADPAPPALGAQRPLNTGCRFSTKLSAPSRWSSVVKRYASDRPTYAPISRASPGADMRRPCFR